MNAHQTEAVRAVRTPIVIWPEPDVSIIVGLLFMIPAYGIAARLRGLLVEEYPREVPPSHFKADRCACFALQAIKIRLRVKLRFFEPSQCDLGGPVPLGKIFRLTRRAYQN